MNFSDKLAEELVNQLYKEELTLEDILLFLQEGFLDIDVVTKTIKLYYGGQMYLQTFSLYPDEIDNPIIADAINKLSYEYHYADSDGLGYVIFNNEDKYKEFCTIINQERSN